MFTEKENLDAKKLDLIDKVLSMTPEQSELMLYLLERHNEIDALAEPARTAKMQELKDEFLRNRQAEKAGEHERAKRGANA